MRMRHKRRLRELWKACCEDSENDWIAYDRYWSSHASRAWRAELRLRKAVHRRLERDLARWHATAEAAAAALGGDAVLDAAVGRFVELREPHWWQYFIGRRQERFWVAARCP